MEATKDMNEKEVELTEFSKGFVLNECVACHRLMNEAEKKAHPGLCTPCKKYIDSMNE